MLQGSASISSADFFGHDQDDSNDDITASDLINRLSFQVKDLYIPKLSPLFRFEPYWWLFESGTTRYIVDSEHSRGNEEEAGNFGLWYLQWSPGQNAVRRRRRGLARMVFFFHFTEKKKEVRGNFKWVYSFPFYVCREAFLELRRGFCCYIKTIWMLLDLCLFADKRKWTRINLIVKIQSVLNVKSSYSIIVY